MQGAGTPLFGGADLVWRAGKISQVRLAVILDVNPGWGGGCGGITAIS